jgi:hypothetical protein
MLHAVSPTRSVAGSSKAAAEPVRSRPQGPPSRKGEFTFLPVDNSQFAWSVRYPDGRVFSLGEEFSGDCDPTLRPAASSAATVRFEFSEQRSCDPARRRAIRVDGASLKSVHGSPLVIASVLTGGNVYGHRSSLISLTANGPKVIRQLK